VRVDLTVGGGTLAVGAGGTLSGAIPIPGNARLCLVTGCGFFFDVPFTANGTRGVALGGAPIVQTIGALGTLSLLGAPFRTGNAVVQTTVGLAWLGGFAHGPLSLTSSTAAPQGVLQAVTPVSVGLVQSGQTVLVLPIFGLLEVKLLPEPAPLAAFSAGGALLAWLGARRARRPRGE
jgi:hypothetical protein